MDFHFVDHSIAILNHDIDYSNTDQQATFHQGWRKT